MAPWCALSLPSPFPHSCSNWRVGYGRGQKAGIATAAPGHSEAVVRERRWCACGLGPRPPVSPEQKESHSSSSGHSAPNRPTQRPGRSHKREAGQFSITALTWVLTRRFAVLREGGRFASGARASLDQAPPHGQLKGPPCVWGMCIIGSGPAPRPVKGAAKDLGRPASEGTRYSQQQHLKEPRSCP